MSRSFFICLLVLFVAFAISAIVAQTQTATSSSSSSTANTTTAGATTNGTTTVTTNGTTATANATTSSSATSSSTSGGNSTSNATTTAPTTSSSTGNATTGNTTSPSGTTRNTTRTLGEGTTAEPTIPCIPAIVGPIFDSPNVTNITYCPQLEGILRPETGVYSMDVNARYLYLQNRTCSFCPKNFLIGRDWICAVIATEYRFDCPDNDRVWGGMYACVTDGTSLKTRCLRNGGTPNDTNPVYNITPAWPAPPKTGPRNCMLQEDGKIVCGQKAFLLRKTAGAPNWVWIFIVGVGGFILLVIIIGVIIFCIPKYWWGEYINPCRWCECCPGYYDI